MYPLIPDYLGIHTVKLQNNVGQTVALPWWLLKEQKDIEVGCFCLLVGTKPIKHFRDNYTAWEAACSQACNTLGLPRTEESFFSHSVDILARELISSHEWWQA